MDTEVRAGEQLPVLLPSAPIRQDADAKCSGKLLRLQAATGLGWLFNGLWIHEHPTAERSKFQVMKLDFSKVTGTLDQLKESLDDISTTGLIYSQRNMRICIQQVLWMR